MSPNINLINSIKNLILIIIIIKFNQEIDLGQCQFDKLIIFLMSQNNIFVIFILKNKGF